MNYMDKMLTYFNSGYGVYAAPDKRADPTKVVVLSGGGIDSFIAALLYKKMITAHFTEESDVFPNKLEFHFVFMDYGQAVAEAESEMASRQAKYLRGNFLKFNDDVGAKLPNVLANRDEQKAEAEKQGIDWKNNNDYLFGRNARFLLAASTYAESIQAATIIIGAVGNVNLDNSHAFLQSIQKTFKLAHSDCVPRIYAPFVLFSKSMVAQVASELGETYKLSRLTTSCFDNKTFFTPTDDKDSKIASKRVPPYSVVLQCGKCRSCNSLRQAFKFACVGDPYYYADNPDDLKALGISTEADVETEEAVDFTPTKKVGKAKPKPAVADDADDDDEDDY